MSYEQVAECAGYIEAVLARQVGPVLRPALALLCDSQLSDTVGQLVPQPLLCLPYSELPGPLGRGEGRLLLGRAQGGLPIALFLGRLDQYDGFTLSECGFPVRLACLLGAARLILCSRAAALSTALHPGQLALVKDHINFGGLSGRSALAGTNDPRFGPRYFPLVEAYSPSWRAATQALGSTLGLSIGECVSAEVGAPQEVTPAEGRALRELGAGILGHSTVAEVLTGVHAGLEVQAIALITGSRVADSEEECGSDAGPRCGEGRLLQLLTAIVSYLVELQGQ